MMQDVCEEEQASNGWTLVDGVDSGIWLSEAKHVV